MLPPRRHGKADEVTVPREGLERLERHGQDVVRAAALVRTKRHARSSPP